MQDTSGLRLFFEKQSQSPDNVADEERHESQKDHHWRRADGHRPAFVCAPGRCRVGLCARRDQWRDRFLGRDAKVSAVCSTQLRPQQADAARRQHARRGVMAGKPKKT